MQRITSGYRVFGFFLTELKRIESGSFLFFTKFLGGLTFHDPPRLQSGLRQNELWRRLRQDVVAQYLLLLWRRWWRRRMRMSCRCTHRSEEHWRRLLVLRPHWARVAVVLQASRHLETREIIRGDGDLPAWAEAHVLERSVNCWDFVALETMCHCCILIEKGLLHILLKKQTTKKKQDGSFSSCGQDDITSCQHKGFLCFF